MFSYVTFLDTAGNVLFWLAVALTALCVGDWMVRTRRINPFGRVGRLYRRYFDPLMAPVEAHVVRRGGLPSSAPWWVLGVVVVGGILLLQVLYILGSIASEAGNASRNPALIPLVLASWAFRILKIAIIVRVISSWLPISPFSKWIRWSYTLTEWFLGPIRRVIPPFSGIDISPLVAYFGLWFIQNLLGIP